MRTIPTEWMIEKLRDVRTTLVESLIKELLDQNRRSIVEFRPNMILSFFIAENIVSIDRLKTQLYQLSLLKTNASYSPEDIGEV